MENSCHYCKIAKGIEPSHKIWENDEFMAFLSIFPNTEAFTIVIPKNHYSGYGVNLPDEILCKLILAAKEVCKILDQKLDDVGRTSIILEAVGVDHLHAKLFPMHGTAKLEKWKPIVSHIDKYFDKYEGYISSHDYVRADDKTLEKLVKKITD